MERGAHRRVAGGGRGIGIGGDEWVKGRGRQGPLTPSFNHPVPECGPRAGNPASVVGGEGARSLWRGDSHLSDSVLPTRPARRRSRPEPRAPPAHAPPWPRRACATSPPQLLPFRRRPRPRPPSTASGGHRGAPRVSAARDGREAGRSPAHKLLLPVPYPRVTPCGGLFSEGEGWSSGRLGSPAG